jgi:hypothetical protein
MLADLRVDELTAMRPKTLEPALLVRSHQPRIARDIGGRGSPPGEAFQSPLLPRATLCSGRRIRARRPPCQPATLKRSLRPQTHSSYNRTRSRGPHPLLILFR